MYPKLHEGHKTSLRNPKSVRQEGFWWYKSAQSNEC